MDMFRTDYGHDFKPVQHGRRTNAERPWKHSSPPYCNDAFGCSKYINTFENLEKSITVAKSTPSHMCHRQ